MIKWLSISLIIVSSCSVKVVNFTNESAAFKTYETYTLVNLKAKNPNISQEGELLFVHIEKAIYNQMQRRSYTFTNSEPNLIIRYELISNQHTDVSYNNNPFYYNPYNSLSVRTFLESALLLEMTDFKTKKLVWQASVDLKNFDSIKNQEELIQAAASQLFDTYLHVAKSNQLNPDLKENK